MTADQRYDSALGGMLGMGIIGAGWGPPGALAGMALGWSMGYLLERRLDHLRKRSAAQEPRQAADDDA